MTLSRDRVARLLLFWRGLSGFKMTRISRGKYRIINPAGERTILIAEDKA